MTKKVTKREDLVSISSYHKKTGLARTTIYNMIDRGDLEAEEIDGTFYVRIKK